MRRTHEISRWGDGFDLTRVDDHASDCGAVTTDPLGRTVCDNVCPVFNGTDQVPWHMHLSVVVSPRGTGMHTSHAKCVVNDQRDFMRMCNLHPTSTQE